MDFSNNAFRVPPSTSKVSDDAMSHANLVMACRWGWTSTPGSDNANTQTPLYTSSTPRTASSTFNNVRTKRFAPCQGRLYHQLLCSHRIRTDLVEDCGTNCVEPLGDAAGLPYFCNECIQGEAAKIWTLRQAEHNATYPPMEQMTKEQSDQWYNEHQTLETEYARDHKEYEKDLRTRTRPSNVCSALEASQEEKEFAAELDSLSFSLMASNEASGVQLQSQVRNRVSLPTDASEQLHWNLNSLALDRGSCGVEYSASHLENGSSTMRCMNEDELWRKSRE
ncbi:hypothetical protein P153DRAFT_379350 [Dothidotthia symphoricarpi CBS 119687]|uniref:Uncharacterized protein n=1 Tax=Dothidotthia symphoricarpi CBS 119687 TaxID=1392245 RepID=A0A6A6A198_9PLEO|nr:uncharacterized protein P153DRAFT_379350 [Dothidotthia symphoricarpi CBS 119687]KAF2124737.1 hypothetical protein P153DRAFT_379350 [Dothidotthia symphoricarpi CBS 119687]